MNKRGLSRRAYMFWVLYPVLPLVVAAFFALDVSGRFEPGVQVVYALIWFGVSGCMAMLSWLVLATARRR